MTLAKTAWVSAPWAVHFMFHLLVGLLAHICECADDTRPWPVPVRGLCPALLHPVWNLAAPYDVTQPSRSQCACAGTYFKCCWAHQPYPNHSLDLYGDAFVFVAAPEDTAVPALGKGKGAGNGNAKAKGNGKGRGKR